MNTHNTAEDYKAFCSNKKITTKYLHVDCNEQFKSEPISNVFNVDCLEYMRGLPDNFFDLAIVDPPYENKDAIGIKNGRSHSAKRKDYHLFKNIAPNREYFTDLNRIAKKEIVWGGNYFGLSGGVIAWDKNGTAFGEGEVAICNTHNSVRFFEYTWNVTG